MQRLVVRLSWTYVNLDKARVVVEYVLIHVTDGDQLRSVLQALVSQL